MPSQTNHYMLLIGTIAADLERPLKVITVNKYSSMTIGRGLYTVKFVA